MATRRKTLVFAADTLTSDVADATITNLAQFTVHIAETCTFVAAWVEFGYQDAITATGGTVTEHRVSLRLGAAAYTTFTETDDIANSGENMAGVIGPILFTSHFQTNWSGPSMTCDVQAYIDYSTGTTLVSRNLTALLYVTIEYDDDPGVNPTQTKTVIIPMESLVSTLSTTANSNIGSNQIPQLTGAGGMLPESTVTVRDWFVVLEGNESNAAVTDWTLSVNVDSGTSRSFGVQECALQSDRFCRWVHKPASPPSTSAAHQWQCWASIARANHLTHTLYVTYTFDATATTRTLCTALIPVEIATPLGITTTAEASRFRRSLFVQDPGTITLRQSAFRINFITTASISGLNFRAGAQSYRAYTQVAGVVCGMFSLQQRIDSGSAQGAGITLARGLNTLTIDGYATDAVDQATNINGLAIINYEADVGTSGIGQNTHWWMVPVYGWNALLQDRVRVNNVTIDIPEANYWIVSAGFLITQWVSASSNALTFDVECLSGEGKDAGYYDIYADAYQADAERACSMTWMRGRDVFKRYPTDPDSERVDIETARGYRLYTSTTAGNGLVAMVCMHSFAYSVTRDITGSDGGTVDIKVCRSDTGEIVATASRGGDGAYSFTWYDNTIPLYAAAEEASANLAGRSEAFTAS